MTSIVSNIAIKVVLVLGLGWGVAGIALGTALGAWVNVGALVWSSRRAGHLRIQSSLRRSVLPSVLAALAAGAGATAGVVLVEHHGFLASAHGLLRDVATLGLAGLLGCAGYGIVVLAFRRRLPISRS